MTWWPGRLAIGAFQLIVLGAIFYGLNGIEPAYGGTWWAVAVPIFIVWLFGMAYLHLRVEREERRRERKRDRANRRARQP